MPEYTESELADLDREIEAPAEDREVPCERLIGAAGTGKTYQLLERTRLDPTYGLLCATTGISAVNLGAITVHSTLRYADTKSLRDVYLSGRLARTLHAVALKHRRLIVEEYSMADGEQLTLWYRGVQEANRYADVEHPLGIMLVGDLAQLPVVKGRWVFDSDVWPEFARNTTRLEHVYRQDQGLFLDALNEARLGHGEAARDYLVRAGATWNTQVDTEFDGTTILPKNDMVDRYNRMALDRVPGKLVLATSRRWGRTRREWAHIPERWEFKIGALVMILSNAPNFSVVNGDTGHVVAYMPATSTDPEHVIVKLFRTGREENIYKLVRADDTPEKPDDWYGETIDADDDDGEYIPRVHLRSRLKRYVTGQVEYFPLRLAWASTVHKSQSLTLDRVQVDYRDWFFGHPAMCYVAFSRCRTLEGLRLVGTKERFVAQCKMEERVRRWL